MNLPVGSNRVRGQHIWARIQETETLKKIKGAKSFLCYSIDRKRMHQFRNPSECLSHTQAEGGWHSPDSHPIFLSAMWGKWHLSVFELFLTFCGFHWGECGSQDCYYFLKITRCVRKLCLSTTWELNIEFTLKSASCADKTSRSQREGQWSFPAGIHRPSPSPADQASPLALCSPLTLRFF